MFGAQCFGEAPFAGLLEFRARGSMPLTGLATATYRLLFAYIDYTSKPLDALPNTPFDGRLQHGFRFDRRLDGDRFTKVGRSYGEASIINIDGALDGLLENYTIDGCPIKLKVLRLTDSYDDAVSVLVGTAQGWRDQGDAILIGVRDNEYLLDVPAQTNVYAGTGGVEGGDDLKGKRKVKAWGDLSANNIKPAFLSSSLLLYQVNDGQVQSIDKVYDNGIEITFSTDYATAALLNAATVSAGQYSTCIAGGYFRLGATPAGIVTADLKGDKLGGAYVNTTGTIIRRLIGASTTIADPGGLNTASFTAIETVQPAVVGYYLDENSSMTVRQVIDELLDGISGLIDFRRSDGVVEIGRIEAPSGSPAARYDETDIVKRPERGDLPNGLTPMSWRYRVEWGHNWTVQQLVEGTVTSARLSYLAQAARVATSSDTALGARIQGSHITARDPEPIKGLYRDQADAQTEADRLLTLFGETRAIYRITVKLGGMIRTLGEVVHVTYPKWDLVDGRLLRIVGISEDTTTNEVELELFG